MAWTTPKNDFTTEALTYAQMNAINENIITLGKGGGKTSTAVATAAASLTLPNSTDRVFSVPLTGSGGISFIDTTSRQPNNEIVLIFSGSPTTWYLSNNVSSPPAGFASIYVYRIGTGSGDLQLYANMRLTLTYNGTNWFCTV